MQVDYKYYSLHRGLNVLKAKRVDNSLPKQAGILRAYTCDVTLSSDELEANKLMENKGNDPRTFRKVARTLVSVHGRKFCPVWNDSNEPKLLNTVLHYLPSRLLKTSNHAQMKNQSMMSEIELQQYIQIQTENIYKV